MRARCALAKRGISAVTSKVRRSELYVDKIASLADQETERYRYLQIVLVAQPLVE